MDNTAFFHYDLFSVCYDELQDASAMMPEELFLARITTAEVRTAVSAAFDAAMSCLDADFATAIKGMYPDVATMLHTVSLHPKKFAAKRPEWSDDQNMQYFDFCHDAISGMLAAIDPKTAIALSSLLNTAIEYVDNHTKPVKFGIILPKLSAQQRTLAETEYNAIVASLSTRARNMIANNGIGMCDCINIAFDHNIDTYHFRNAGVNTFKEIRERFLHFYDFVMSVKDMPERELLSANTSKLLPFLTAEQMGWVTNYHEREEHLPLVYIIHAYYSTSTARHDSVFALYHGFRGERLSRAAIGKALGISNERTRQILMAYEMPDSLQKVVAQYIDHYKQLRQPVIDVHDIADELIDREFGNNYDKRQEITIDSLLASLKLMLGGEIVYYHQRSYLCTDTFMKHFDLRAALKSIDDAFETRRNSTVSMLVSSFVTPYLTVGTDAPDEAYITQQIMSIVANTIALPVVQAPCFLLMQNSVIVENEIFAILAKNGSPMTLKEIQHVLAQKFQFRDFSRLESLRGYLVRSERIIAIGKTSTYALREWELDTMTIREHIYSIIDASTCPLSIKEIKKMLLAKGHERSWTNIYSTIFSDSTRGYARYNNNLFGIASKTYPSKYKIMPLKAKDTAK